jgi:hypothetical protein
VLRRRLEALWVSLRYNSNQGGNRGGEALKTSHSEAGDQSALALHHQQPHLRPDNPQPHR